MVKKKLIGFKDLVLISLLTALSLVIQLGVGIPFVAVPQLMMFVAVGIILVLSGPVYVLMLTKTGKMGAAFLYSGLQALYYIILGQFLIGISFLACGIISEIILLNGGYERPTRVGISYMFFGVIYITGSYLPFLILAEKYTTELLNSGVSQEMVDMMMNWYGSPVIVLMACLNAILWAAVGAFLGFRMRKKHFEPSGIL